MNFDLTIPVSLAQNIAELLALAFFYSLLLPRLLRFSPRVRSIIQGLIFGFFGSLAILSGLQIAPGFILDSRSVILSIAGFAGGPVSGLIAAVIIALFRVFFIDTPVTLIAVITIFLCAGVGVALGYYVRRRGIRVTAQSFLLLGIVTTVARAAVSLLLTTPETLNIVLSTIVPTLILFPPGTWLLGALILTQERHRAAVEALAAERRTMRTLIDNVPDYIFVKDTNKRFILSNLAHSRATQERMEQAVLGKDSSSFFPDELAAQYAKDDDDALRGESILAQERLTLDANGDHIWVSTTKVPMRNEYGEIVGVVGISRDITEQKRTAEALKLKVEQDQLLRAKLEALFSISIELTQLDRLEDFYRRVVQLGIDTLGFERFGLLLLDKESGNAIGTYGTNRAGQVLPEQHIVIAPADLTGILKRAMETRERFAFDENVQLYDNLQFIGEGWNAAAVLWNGIESLGWVTCDNGVQHQPVSQPMLEALALYAQIVSALLGRKRADEALRQSEFRNRRILEAASEGIWMLNADEVVTFINPHMAHVLGYTVDEMLGQPVSKFTHPDDVKLSRDKSLRRRQGITEEYDIRLLARDGQVRWTIVSATPMTDEHGNFIGSLSMTADITDRKNVEQRELELIAERQRVQVLKRFIGDMSHDFRTPLSILQTGLFIMRKSASEAQHPRIDKLEEQVKRLSSLFDEMLDVYTLEREEQVILNARDINSVIGEVVEKHQARAESKAQKLVFDAGADLPQIMIDPWLIDHALSHILGNALTYTGENGVVTIRTRIDGREEVVLIEDNGEGIPSDALPHIFDHFYRADQARSTTTGGSGLGLSIARKIIEAHRGTISVQSESGKGTTVRIALPIPELTATQLP